MQAAPIPSNEKERLESLYKLKILDTPPEERFDRITRLATELFKVPISTITLVDSDREWFKSCQGLTNGSGDRAIAFCAHTILTSGVFIVPDAKKDPRFADNPMVTGDPYIRFYAAVPLSGPDGLRVGAFCIKDREPRTLNDEEIQFLKDLGSWAELELNLHELSSALEARKKAEEKIMAGEKFLRQVIDTDPNAIFVKDYNGKYVMANKALFALYKTTADNLIGKTDADFHPNKTEVESFLADDRHVMDKGEPKFIPEEPFTDPQTGVIKWFQTIKVPLILDNNKAKQVLGVATDITARKNTGEALKLAKAKVEEVKVQDEAILSSIGEGLIAVDRQRKMLVLNKAAEDILDWKTIDMVGKEFIGLPLLDAENNPVPTEEKPIFIALKTGKTIHSSDYSIIDKQGAKISLGVTVTPVILKEEILGAVIIFRDISKEKELDRAKTEFVSLASHQLRTPLGISKWYLEAMKEDDLIRKDIKTAEQYLDEVYSSNERLIKLVKDLLSVSRIDQSKISSEPTLVDILKIIENIVKQMEIEAETKEIQLLLKNNTQNLSLVKVDPEKFQEVIENLLSNGIRYSNPNGVVEITLSNTPTQLQIDIKDNGIGISEVDQQQIFTKFFRTPAAVKLDTSGTGLGLYIVKSYIERWGGKIWFQSEENKGSVFHISLPLI